MSYYKTTHKLSPSFTVAVAGCAVRNALRPFLRHQGTAYVAILLVPKGTAGYYKRAVDALIADPMPVDEECNELVVVITVADAPVLPGTVFSRFRHGRQVVIVSESSEFIPLEVRAAADIVKEIASPPAPHFIAAGRKLGMSGLTPDIAAFLSGFTFDVLAGTVRGNRPIASAVRHLKRVVAEREKEKATVEPAATKGPRLEDMAGYGAAKTWGLRLAEDLKAWKAGELAWEDVDRGTLASRRSSTGRTPCCWRGGQNSTFLPRNSLSEATSKGRRSAGFSVRSLEIPHPSPHDG